MDFSARSSHLPRRSFQSSIVWLRSAGIAGIVTACLSPGAARAQEPGGELAGLGGLITDSSGAAIAHARIHVEGRGNGREIGRELEAGAVGRFELTLPPGVYTVEVRAEGFDPLRRSRVTLHAGETLKLPLRLEVAHVETNLNVGGEDDGRDPAPAGADVGAIVLSGKGLAGLSDDDNTFQQQLQTLAGTMGEAPSVLVNGFSTTRIPPKQEIQSVRINTNPYSAMYDAPGTGRIEITTRAGQQSWHGQASMQGTTAGLNSPNPFPRLSNPNYVQPDYNQVWGRGSAGGSLGRRTAVFGSADTNALHNNVVVNAVQLTAPNIGAIGSPVSLASPAPVFSQAYAGTLGRQWSRSNQMTLRLQWAGQSQTNAGTGSQTLPEAGYNADTGTWTLQLRDLQTGGAHWVFDEGMQYIRTRVRQDPNTFGPTLLVEGVAMGGGSPMGSLRDDTDTWELQQTSTFAHRHHLLRFGGRTRIYRDSNSSSANFNGQYIFPTLAAYVSDPINYSGASQYSKTMGQAAAIVLETDTAVFIEDEWTPRPNLTLTAGFRFETQSSIQDKADPAPRLGAAYSVTRRGAKTPLITLRGGAGLFYDRFLIANLLTAVRQNGVSQVTSVTDFGSGQANEPVPTKYSISPTLHAPTDIGLTLTAEHRFPRARLVGNMFYVHSAHLFLSRNINAPLPETYDPTNPSSGVRPHGNTANLYQFSSDGTGNSLLAQASLQWQATKGFSFMTLVGGQRARSDAFGITVFPSNQYNLKQDYGPPTRNTLQATVLGDWHLGHGFFAQPFVTYRGGTPYNVTTGTDLNGDQQYNDRPAFAGSSTRATVVSTPLGALDSVPTAGETLVPFNYGRSPGLFEVDLSLGKDFTLGPRTAGSAGKRPWTWSFAATTENLTNHTSAAPPIGVLLSPFFGKSINTQPNFIGLSAANRVIYFSSKFLF